MSKILIIEDESSIRRVLKNILSEEDSKLIIDEAENGEIGLNSFLANSYDLVICDIKMPKMDGVEVLEKAMKEKPEIPFIMISGHGDIDVAVDCIKKGAFDYISKPPDLNRLLNTIRNALNKKNLLHENNSLKTENRRLKNRILKKHEIIGESKAIVSIKEMIEKVAPTDARVLITGGNGTGKESIAHWLHHKSNRVKNPFIAVNCAAIPSELIESELFGHEKGSFTGANKQKIGKFELADGGTLFLDEIGDMSLSAQAKVLRVLQEKQVTRVGGDKPKKIDVRVLAATNKNLKKQIEENKFREDLYHRLAVILIEVPSLNERKEDISLLVDYFSKIICEEQGITLKKFSKKSIQEFEKHNWTGNIRELRNFVERLIILGGEEEVTDKDVKLYT